MYWGGSKLCSIFKGICHKGGRTCLAALFATSVWQPAPLPCLSLFTFHSSASSEPQSPFLISRSPLGSLHLLTVTANDERAPQLLQNTIRKDWPGDWLWALCILFPDCLTVVGNIVNMIKGNESISKTQKRQQRSEVLPGRSYLKNKSLNRDLMSGRSKSIKTSMPLEEISPFI